MFLVGSAVAAAGMAAKTALAQSPPAAGQLLAPSDLAEFDPAYVENVIVPHFLMSTRLPMINCRVHQGERASLPVGPTTVIGDDVDFTRQA